jgi:hypothetical protein
MGFWGWRQSAATAFLSVLVTACMPLQPAPLPRTAVSAVPVTLAVQEMSTSPPVAPTPVRVITVIKHTEHDPEGVEISQPDCAETRLQGWQCLGLIHNVTDAPLGPMEIVVKQDGLSVTHLVAWRLVMPGESVPYRFMVDAADPLVELSLNPPQSERGLQRLDAEFSRSDSESSVVLHLHNAQDNALAHIRVVLMLSDKEGDLIGFRTQLIERLEARASLDIIMHMRGLGDSPAFTLRVVAEGWRE